MSDFDWIRTMRKKQGLKGFQLAEKLNVSPARVSVMERDESRGAVTLKMMERAAEAMGCKFEYRIVPLVQSAGDDSKSSKPRYRVVANNAVKNEK
ncbi:MAG: helix-turn-helix domain-containing protein [Proteobacteria bacterium]|nr:helix-turn-helix domain-containing protein [Pseudomonadota bacterium]